MAKKSLYVFLSGILGMLLFLIIHQILAFIYLSLLYANYSAFGFGLSFTDFLAVDYCTMILALLMGAWYGIWLGLHWFNMVYENQGHGFVGHLVSNYWPNRSKTFNLKSKLAVVESKLQGDLMELENIAHKLDQPTPKRRVVRRKV